MTPARARGMDARDHARGALGGARAKEEDEASSGDLLDRFILDL